MNFWCLQAKGHVKYQITQSTQDKRVIYAYLRLFIHAFPQVFDHVC